MTPGASRAGLGRHRGVRGWALVAVLAVTETVSWGVLYYALPVLIVPMGDDLGWSTAELAGGLSLALAVSALAGLPVGRWLDRRAPRAPMVAGSGFVAGCSQVHSMIAFYLVWAGIGGAMAPRLPETPEMDDTHQRPHGGPGSCNARSAGILLPPGASGSVKRETSSVEMRRVEVTPPRS